MSMSWQAMAAALRYGYSVQYLMRVDSIPTLFVEAEGDAIAPAGYDIDASLVVDRSARVGSVPDPSTHLGRGFDLEARLMDTPAVRAYMSGPSAYTVLADDLAHDDTSALVGSTTGLDEVRIWIDRELVTWSVRDADRFYGLTRGAYGAAVAHGRGTIVTDAPTSWEELRVELWAVLIDPLGRYVQGSDILSQASMLWAGEVSTRPEFTGSEWAFSVRDQVRRLSQRLGVAASGTVVQEINDDALWPVDEATAITIDLTDGVGILIFSAQVRPFTGQPARLRASQMRQLIADALAAATSSVTEVLSWRWQLAESTAPDVRRIWALYVTIDTGAAFTFGFNEARVTGGRGTIWGTGGMVLLPDVPSAVDTGLRADTYAIGVSLALVLDEHDGAIPTAGVIAIEGSGRVDYKRFIDATPDPANAARLNLTLAPSDRLGPRDMWAASEGERAELSGRIMWADSGTLPDILRRAIVSTGLGTGGVWDTLPAGQGLALPSMDADSFDAVFGGVFDGIQMDLVIDAGTSLDEAVGDILRLSRRAIITRPSTDGSAVEVAAINIGTADSLTSSAIVTDADLVSSPGRRPVRATALWGRPQVITCKCKQVPVGVDEPADALIIYTDVSRRRKNPTAWKLELNGVSREDILAPGEAWATGWFRASQNYQVLEVDVVPWSARRAGETVRLELYDPTAWDYARAVPEISAWALVLGTQMDLTTQVVTMTVVIDGMGGSKPMSPSLPIVAVNGGATTPTSIDVDEEYYDLLVSAKDGQSTWQMLAYRPGYDYGHAAYTFTTVTLPGGGVARLTVTGLPALTVSLTTDFRLTFPVSDDCTEWQSFHLHNTDRAQWG